VVEPNSPLIGTPGFTARSIASRTIVFPECFVGSGDIFTLLLPL
jgi:hypothetical protein